MKTSEVTLKSFAITVAIVAAQVTTVFTRPDGAPLSTCNTLAPAAPHGSPQTSTSPYSIALDKQEVNQGETVRVTIESSSGDTFRGLLVIAIEEGAPGYTDFYGTFEPEEADRLKPLDCGSIPGSGITHSSNIDKNVAHLQWTAPSRDGRYVFAATVMKNRATFWSKYNSEVITVGTGVAPTTAVPNTTETTTYIPDFGNPQEFYTGCGNTKGCFGIPSGCVGDRSCEILVSWSPDANDETVRFEMSGKMPWQSGSSYVAVGISSDDAMGDDSVIGCRLENNRIVANEYVNTDSPKGNQGVVRDQSIISDVKGSYVDGYILCSFSVKSTFDVMGTGASNFINVDLIDSSYFLLVARGSDSAEDYLDKHPTTTDREVSTEAVNFEQNVILGAKSNLLIRLHGSFMILAWILCAPFGMFVARYYKQNYSPVKPCGVAFWFAVHRSCMALAVLLTVVGTVLIFVYVDGYTEANNENAETYHPILGIVVTALAVLQVCIAMVRPQPSAKNRPIFNWVHWIIGNGSHIIAIAAIFLANDLAKTNLLSSQRYWVALVVFIGYHLLLHLLMTVAAGSAVRRMKLSQNRVFKFGPLSGSPEDDERVMLKPHKKTFNMIRTALLILYLLGAGAVAATLIYFVLERL